MQIEGLSHHLQPLNLQLYQPSKPMFNKLIKYLSSLRFTILLICLLGLMFIIGLWVPQTEPVEDDLS